MLFEWKFSTDPKALPSYFGSGSKKAETVQNELYFPEKLFRTVSASCYLELDSYICR